MQEEEKGRPRFWQKKRDISPGQEPVSPRPWYIPEGSLQTSNPFLCFLLEKDLKRLDKAENENYENSKEVSLP